MEPDMTLNDQMTVDICRKMRDDVDGAIQRNFEVGTAVGIPAAALLIVAAAAGITPYSASIGVRFGTAKMTDEQAAQFKPACDMIAALMIARVGDTNLSAEQLRQTVVGDMLALIAARRWPKTAGVTPQAMAKAARDFF
jgi:hypothetical protein